MDDGQLIFHVDVAGRRDSQVSQSVATVTAGTEFVCVAVAAIATPALKPHHYILFIWLFLTFFLVCVIVRVFFCSVLVADVCGFFFLLFVF